MTAEPEWLAHDYIECALRAHHKNEDLTLLQFEVNPALEPGENYCGVLTRLVVKFKVAGSSSEVLQHLIVKTSIDDDELSQELMAPYDIFNREINIYEQVLPKLNELLHEIGEYEQIFPIAVYVDRERMAIIFEDLAVKGFVMADRIKRLDLEHTQLILRKLAKIHAASAVLNERNGSLEHFDRGLFNRYTNSYSGYFVGTLLAAARWLSQQPELEKYGHKLHRLAPHYMHIGRRCFEPTPGHLNVLAHGDVWTNNMMFKYDAETGKPLDVMLFDFQYSFWGSPTMDLHQLFNTSLKDSLRMDKQNALFQFYYHNLKNTLQKFNYQQCKIPTLHEFTLHAAQKRFYAMHSAVVVQPVMINEDPTDASFNALMSDDERGVAFKNRLYKNPTVQQNLKILMVDFDNEGLLEINQCS